MKNYLKSIILLLAAIPFANCSDDTELPQQSQPVYSEDFTRPTGETQFNFVDQGWTLFAQAGTKNWFKDDFGGNDYIEFSSFGSGEASNIGWTITPEINIDNATQKKLIFQSAQHHATSLDNKFELLVSDDFDGTNVLAAHWTVLNFRKPSYTSATNYDFVNSGGVSLSDFSGNIHVAFRVIGNGTFNTNQAGGFEVDNLKIF
jgi:hypothetical protein